MGWPLKKLDDVCSVSGGTGISTLLSFDAESSVNVVPEPKSLSSCTLFSKKKYR